MTEVTENRINNGVYVIIDIIIINIYIAEKLLVSLSQRLNFYAVKKLILFSYFYT